MGESGVIEDYWYVINFPTDLISRLTYLFYQARGEERQAEIHYRKAHSGLILE